MIKHSDGCSGVPYTSDGYGCGWLNIRGDSGVDGDGDGAGNGYGDGHNYGDGDDCGIWPSHILVADADEESCFLLAAVEVVE